MFKEAADPDANIIWGVAFNDDMDDEIAITAIAAGFDEPIAAPAPVVEEKPVVKPEPAPAPVAEPVVEPQPAPVNPEPRRSPQDEWDVWLRDFSAKNEKMSLGTADVTKPVTSTFEKDISDLLDLDKHPEN